MRTLINYGLWGLALFLAAGDARGGSFDDALAAIKAVKREGGGNVAASGGWQVVVKYGPAGLPRVLAAFDGADATVANWLHSAVDAIVENELRDGRPIPLEQVEAFFNDRARDPRARHLALQVILRVDPPMRDRLLPKLLTDASAGVRREAVAYALERLPAENKKEALQRLFVVARDVDQVEAIAKQLKALGDEPDVVKHLGLITRWELAGPFDNTGLKGFAAPLPKVEKWTAHATGHPRAQVELYPALGKAKGLDKATGKKDAVYALARTVVESPTEQTVEVRAATQNAVKIYVNGQEAFAREEYHHGQTLDQHVARVKLNKGPNEILLKVCQDDMTYEWTFPWAFQVRVCDAIGGAVPLTVLTAPNATPVVPQPDPKEKK